MLKQIYTGRTSMEDGATVVGGYSDVYMDSMDASKPGKAAGGDAAAPFEIVSEHQMDFEHYKNRPEFRDEAGGDGELFGHAQDMIRPGTPSTFTTMTRTGTMQTMESYDNRSRSESRDAYSRSRSESRDSDRTKVAGETTYPRGYHQTPSGLRESSPARNSEDSGDVGAGRAGHMRIGPSALRDEESALMSGAAGMGRSEPPAPTPGGLGPIQTPGSTPGDGEKTSYDYFKRGRNL
jgi:calcium permeable stress-gated cation channel